MAAGLTSCPQKDCSAAGPNHDDGAQAGCHTAAGVRRHRLSRSLPGKRWSLTGLGLTLMLLIGGCAETGPFVGMFPGPQRSLAANQFRRLALDAERQDELRLALLYWKACGSLLPGDQQAANQVAVLQTVCRRLADHHYQNGLRFYRRDQLTDARDEFLEVLRYDPDHVQALSLIKSITSKRVTSSYLVQPRDTLTSIAKTQYQDPAKDFLVAYFNNLPPKTELEPGTLIELPLLEDTQLRPLVDVESQLRRAKLFFDQQQYDKVMVVLEKTLRQDPDNKEAQRLKNSATFLVAERLRRKENYLEALSMYKSVDPAYPGVQEAIANVTETLRQKAQTYYLMGVGYFVNEELELAIEYWEKALTLNPDHPKAKADIQNARRLLRKLDEVE
jgi:tetratricopeptide (TPR) repeat protein